MELRGWQRPGNLIYLVILFMAPAMMAGQSDVPWRTGVSSPQIEKLNKDIKAANGAAVLHFWDQMQQQHDPLIEPIAGDSTHSLVTFVYRGSPDTKSVVLYCQMIVGRDPGVNVMSHLTGSDVWFKTYSVRNDTRLSYSFIPNPTPQSVNSPDAGIADPLNPKAAPETPYMGHSVLELPAAAPQPWIVPRAGVHAGKIEEFSIKSGVLHAERKAWIYTPAGFDGSRPAPYPLLICFDGEAYASPDYMPLPTIVDNLVAAGKIPPLVMVLVAQAAQPNRNIELSNNQAFLDFVADELLPKVRQKWHATSRPEETVVTGSSAGGLAAVFFAFRRPTVFGNVLSQSGALWPGQRRSDPDHEWLTRQFENSPRLPVRFVLQVGLLERGPTPGNGPSILETNRHLHKVLVSKGYEVHYSEIAGGHEPLNWRGGIADGLIQLIGSKPRGDTSRIEGQRSNNARQ